MLNPPTTAAVWPPGWRPATKQAWRSLGLDVEQARLFRDSGWTPSAALKGVYELTGDELELLRSDAPPTIRPGSVVHHVLRLHRAGVASATNDWDAAAITVLKDLRWPGDVAAQLDPGDDPVLTVLATLHKLDADLPADVALARHCDEGCHCDDARFPTYLGIGRIELAEQDHHTVVMTTDEGATLHIRTGRYLAARIGTGPWVRLPDLVSACWYLHRTVQEDAVVVEVDSSTAGLRCVIAMAQLNPAAGDLEINVAGTTLTWDGSALLPEEDVPDWMVVAESAWESEQPMNSGGGGTYLIEINGTFYFRGGEMGWSEVGPFDSVGEAEAWFKEEVGEAESSSDYGEEEFNEE